MNGTNGAPAAPAENGHGEAGAAVVHRKGCGDWEYLHQKYLLKDLTFNRQFSHLYNARLDLVQKECAASAAQRWPDVPQSRVVNLSERCVLIGALYKNMDSKPNFLCQYTREVESEIVENDVPFAASSSDTLSLEDQSGRVKLSGEIPVNSLATGLIVAVVGTPVKDTFVVEEWAFPSAAPQAALPLRTGPPCYVAIVSGLNFGSLTPLQELRLDAASSFLRGCMGCTDIVANITKLIVAGGLIGPTPDLQIQEKIKLEMDDHKQLSQAASVSPMRLADEWVAQVAESLPTDVMPSKSDPTNPFLPFQPLHPCLMPRSGQLGTVSLVTSPCDFSCNGVQASGTSGENLNELVAYTMDVAPVALLKTAVQARLLAPTAPDTLYCYPYKGVDPLQLQRTPHLVFCGNAAGFETEWAEIAPAGAEEGAQAVCSRLVVVPQFSVSPGITLVDINSPTLETVFVEIDVDDE